MMFMYGAKILINRKWVKIVNNCILAINIFDMMYKLIFFVFEYQIAIISRLDAIAFSTVSLLLLLNLIMNKSQLAEIANQLKSIEDNDVIRQMKLITWTLVGLHVMDTIASLVIGFGQSLVNNEIIHEDLNYVSTPYPLWLQIVVIVRKLTNMVGWLDFIHLSVYPFVYLAINVELIEQHRLTSIFKYDSIDIVSILRFKNKMNQIRQRLQSMFSFAWLGTFSYLLIGGVGNLDYIRNLGSNSTDSVILTSWITFYFLEQLVLQFILVYMISFYQSKTIDTIENLFSKMVDKVTSIDDLNRLRGLRRQLTETVDYHACHLFNIDFSLILNFMSAFVSITVMYFQF